MSKKKKKSKPEAPKRKGGGLFNKLVMVLVVAAAIAIYKPELIPSPEYQNQAQQLRDQIITYLPKSKDQANESSVSSQISFSQLKSMLPQGEILGEEDVYVEESLEQIYQLIQKLPQEKINTIKSQMCQDVVDQALQEASLKQE